MFNPNRTVQFRQSLFRWIFVLKFKSVFRSSSIFSLEIFAIRAFQWSPISCRRIYSLEWIAAHFGTPHRMVRWLWSCSSGRLRSVKWDFNPCASRRFPSETNFTLIDISFFSLYRSVSEFVQSQQYCVTFDVKTTSDLCFPTTSTSSTTSVKWDSGRIDTIKGIRLFQNDYHHYHEE